jgi:hypothetical protein
MESWLTSNWHWCLLGFFICEKLVKMTPMKADDILLDIIWKSLKKIAKKK